MYLSSFQVSKGPKQLKGILKGGKSNITSNPMAPADQANLQQSTMVCFHENFSGKVFK
jgi:hypothetical protein